jgi:hypothetical protein
METKKKKNEKIKLKAKTQFSFHDNFFPRIASCAGQNDGLSGLSGACEAISWQVSHGTIETLHKNLFETLKSPWLRHSP